MTLVEGRHGVPGQCRCAIEVELVRWWALSGFETRSAQKGESTV